VQKPFSHSLYQIDQFLESLIHYDKENIHPNIITALEPYLKDKEFDPEYIRSKSAAAAGLCSWVINIVKFYEVYCDVEPKRRALEEANAELAEAQDTLAAVKAKVGEPFIKETSTWNFKSRRSKHHGGFLLHPSRRHFVVGLSELYTAWASICLKIALLL